MYLEPIFPCGRFEAFIQKRSVHERIGAKNAEFEEMIKQQVVTSSSETTGKEELTKK